MPLQIPLLTTYWSHIKRQLILTALLCSVAFGCQGVGTLTNGEPIATTTEASPPSRVPKSIIVRDTPGLTSADCNGDTAPPNLTSGWKLLWQHSFEHPIAQPPVSVGSQVFVLERVNPFIGEGIDTLWTMDSQTATIQWRFENVENVNSDMWIARWIGDIRLGQKYLAVRIQYSQPQTSANFGLEEYVVVVNRASGQVIFSQPLHALELAISDDALYYRSAARHLYRIDLDSGQQRWLDTHTTSLSRGIFPVDSWLYVFDQREDGLQIYRYDPFSGTVVSSNLLTSLQSNNVMVHERDAFTRGVHMIASVDLQTLTEQWRANIEYPLWKNSNAFPDDFPSLFLTQNAIFGFDAQGSLLKINESDGKVIWTKSFSGIEPMSRPVVADGIVYGLFSDGTIQAFSEDDGVSVGTVMKVPLWYWLRSDTKEQRRVVGGLEVAGDMLFVTTGCRSVYAIQHAPQ